MVYPNRECRFFIPKEEWVYSEEEYKLFLEKLKKIVKALSQAKKDILKKSPKRLPYAAVVASQEAMKDSEPIPMILNRKQLYYRLGLALYGKINLNQPIGLTLKYYGKKFNKKGYIYAKRFSIKKYEEARNNITEKE